MLKIEKINRASDIVIEFRKRDIFFNEALLKALSIAFILHSTAFLIFHIGPFKLVNNGILPPSIVEIDVIDTDFQVTANIQDKRKLSRIPFAPKVSLPTIPSISKLGLIDYIDTIENFESKDNLFLKLETDLKNDLFFLSDELRPKAVTTQILLSGNLSNRKFEDPTTLIEKQFKDIALTNPLRVIYNVKVENKTGRIFFAELEMPLSHPYVSPVGEILKEFRFEQISSGFMTSGQIEFVLNGEKS